jgi:hypothetical protein
MINCCVRACVRACVYHQTLNPLSFIHLRACHMGPRSDISECDVGLKSMEAARNEQVHNIFDYCFGHLSLSLSRVEIAEYYPCLSDMSD